MSILFYCPKTRSGRYSFDEAPKDALDKKYAVKKKIGKEYASEKKSEKNMHRKKKSEKNMHRKKNNCNRVCVESKQNTYGKGRCRKLKKAE